MPITNNIQQLPNIITKTTKKRKTTDASKREYGNKWEPVYNKKVNIKKLQNLLDNAIAGGKTTVELGGKIITLHELEDIIREKAPKKYKVHPLLSMEDKDIIPWYYSDVDLSLVYKDQDNKKYYVDDIAVLSTFPELKYTFSHDTNKKKPFTQVMHEFTAVDENFNEHKIPYTLYVQNAPANKVFTNNKFNGQIDVFTYNISYLYIGERRHDAKSNSDVVKFISTDNSNIGNNTFTYKHPDGSYIGYANDSGNKSIGYIKTTDDNVLHLNTNNTVKIVAKPNNETRVIYGECEIWDLDNLNFIPALSINNCLDNKNLPVSYSTIAVTTGLSYNVSSNNEIKVIVEPYSYYLLDKTYSDWKNHVSLLRGENKFVRHEISSHFIEPNENIEAYPKFYCSYMSNSYMVNLCNIINSVGQSISYIVDGKTKNYVFDKPETELLEQTFDPYSFTYLCTTKSGSDIITSETKVSLQKVHTSVNLTNSNEDTTYYKLSETEFDFPNKLKLGFKYRGHICEDIPIDIKSYFVNPLNGNRINESAELNLNTTLEVRSNPILSCGCEIKKTIDNNSNSLIVSLHNINNNYKTTVSSIGYLGDGSTNMLMNVEIYNSEQNVFEQYTNEGNSVTGLAFGFSYDIIGSGITENNNFTNIYHKENKIGHRYSYLISEDQTNITRPAINSLEHPDVSVDYIGKNAVLTVSSDEFIIWNNELTSVNAFGDSVGSTYFVKNSMYVVPATIPENKVTFTYLHKGNLNDISYIGTVDISIENKTKSKTEWITDEHDLDIFNTKTQWKYTYDLYNDGYEDYINIDLVNSGINLVNLSYADITDLVNKLIPNEVFSLLYRKYSNIVSTGFCQLDSDAEPLITSNGLILRKLALFEPSGFQTANQQGVYLEPLTDFCYIKNNGDPVMYPVFRDQYFLCEELTAENEHTGKYYLYCIFNTYTSPEDNLRSKILPPFIFRLNKFNIDDKNIELQSDYETYINNIKEIKRFDLLRPENEVSSYVLFGFNKDIVNSLQYKTNMLNSVHTGNEIIHNDFIYDDVVLASVTTTYTLDNNNKLYSVDYSTYNLLRGTSYDYVDSYTGTYMINSFAMDKNYSINLKHKPKNLFVCTYVKVEFEDDENNKINPIFRLDKNTSGTLCDANNYIIYPQLIDGYVSYSCPGLTV